MALDTFGDLKTYIQRTRRDATGDTPGYDHWTEAQTEDDINNAIQEFWDEVPSGTEWVTFEPAPDALDASEYVADLTRGDIGEIVHLQTGYRRLLPATPTDLFARDAGWDGRAGTPTDYIPAYRRDSNEKLVIRVWPTPDAALTDLKGEFTRVHPWLISDDERLLVPVQYRMAVVAFALHLGYAADKQETQDLVKASFWLAKYRDYLKRAKRKAARRNDRSAPTVALQR